MANSDHAIGGKDDVIIEGDVGALTVAASGITVTTEAASIAETKIAGENSSIIVNQTTKIHRVIVNSPGTDISGAGQLGQVEANASEVKVTTIGIKITASEGTTGIWAGMVPIG